MKWKIIPNAVNQFSIGTEIYMEGETVSSVALILKGRIIVRNEGAQYTVRSGVFLGINDLYTGSYHSTYTAQDDVILYVFGISCSEEIETILAINKDYHGFMVASLNRIILELDKIYQGLIKNGLDLYQFLSDQYKAYLQAAARLGYPATTSKRLESLSMFQGNLELEQDRINYYKECANQPIDVVKAFYSYGNSITLYQVGDQVDIINRQFEVLKELSEEFVQMTEGLIDESETCLFQLIAAFAVEIEAAEGSNKQVMDVMDSIIEKINLAETFCEHMLGRRLKVNRKRMEETYHLLLTGTKGEDVNTKAYLKYSREDSERAVSELNDSYAQILQYAGFEAAKAEEMKLAMLNFVNLKDRLSAEDNARAIRKRLTTNHYIIYKEVFMKAYKEKGASRIIEMFLDYGYADERLLSEEQLLSLYFLKEEKAKGDIHIYGIRDWLTLIYEGKKEPSKNEFDLEYPEVIADYKRQGKLNEKEIHEWISNPEKKLEHEIQNMFRYNNKTTNGQISIFVPVLHKDMLVNQFDRLYLSPGKINDAMKELMRIDYSIFDREVLYSSKALNIVKEYIIKRVYPDIILMPIAGNNGIMWQEITGRRRDSSGRFLFPVFCETDIKAILVRVFGRFRWEMCRSIEGMAWNDIKHKSLTSEYSDYLQFYRKNRDLSEERKEKIKLQIQRGRNSREVFVIDYEQWINYESMGAIKLNKPIRELMATYCPFSKGLREQLMIQPLFEEAMARFIRERLKKIREIESRYRQLQKDQVELTKELEDTLTYYKET